MTTKTFTSTATMPAYAVFLPDGYNPAKKYKTNIFLHGIGESKKSMQDFIAWGGWNGLKLSCDKYNMVILLPQNHNANIFADGEVNKIYDLAIANYSIDGNIGLWGLSMGAGAVMSVAATTLPQLSHFASFVALCPPTWDGLNFKNIALSGVPLWIFAGAKDVADPATKIERITKSVNAIKAAGRTKDFYFTVFPLDDHQIWPEVLGAVGVPAATVNNAIEFNNPAWDIYQFGNAQKKGGPYVPIPLAGAVQPAPPPVDNDPVIATHKLEVHKSGRIQIT